MGFQSLDSSRRKMDQRSPKSDTPSRERYKAGGMGQKSSSTSQLSATGKNISLPSNKLDDS
jgi:hypothetical protein